MNSIEDFFRKYEHKDDVYKYYPNPGNAGDSLIALGTFHFLKKNNINYEVLSEKNVNLAGQNIIYGGGGNLGLMSNHSSKFLSKHHAKLRKLIILPHTLKEIDPLIREFGDNVYVFCREKTSFNYVKKTNSSVNIFLNDDMAFYTDISIINNNFNIKNISKYYVNFLFNKLNVLNIPILSKSSLIKLINYEGLIDNVINHSKDNKILNCFRNDGERTEIKIPEDNFDLSELLELSVISEEITMYIISRLFLILKSFDLIRTNRLHIAISCALLNIDVEFYPNNYFKCQAIYEFSLKENYPCVRWMGS